MSDYSDIHLSRRERQVMNILFERGESSAQEVLAVIPNPPSYSAVRSLLSKLEGKGLIAHREDGPRYVYKPTKEPEEASTSALKQTVTTFFEGSALKTVNALFKMKKFSDEDLETLQQAISQARKEGR